MDRKTSEFLAQALLAALVAEHSARPREARLKAGKVEKV
jgi:hypothetical protein